MNYVFIGELFVRMFAVERLVEANLLWRFRDFHRGESINDAQHGVGEHKRPDRREHNGGYLLQKEHWIAVQQPIGTFGIELFVGEDAQHDDAEEATDAVDSPHVECVVPLQLVLHFDCVIANHAGNDADDHRRSRRNVACGWSYGGESGDRAGKQAQELWLLLVQPRHQQPRDCGKGSGNISIQEGRSRDGIHAHFTAGVETVPAKPQQARTQRYQRNAVRAAVLHAALAYIDDGGQRRDAGDVVDDNASGKVLDAPLLKKSPSPHHVDKREVDEG